MPELHLHRELVLTGRLAGNQPMKNSYFLKRLFSILTCVAFLSGITGPLAAQNTSIPEIPGIKSTKPSNRLNGNNLPQKSNYYIWENGWQLDTRMEYTYDSQGNILKSVAFDGVSGQVMEQTVYTYDSRNNQTERLVQTMVNGQLTNQSGQKHFLLYDTNNRITEDITQEWHAGGWQNAAKNNYIFNTAGQQTEEKISLWQNGAWVNNVKRTLTYQNDLLTVYVVQNHGSNGWENFSRFTDYTYDAVTKKVLSFKVQNWVTNTWQDNNRQTYLYDATGGYTHTTEKLINGTWINSLKAVSVKNPVSNISGYELYDWQNTQWQKITHQEVQHAFDAQSRLVEAIEKRWKPASNQLENELKVTFFDFQQINAAPDQLPENALTVFPNPASEILTLTLNQSAGEEGSVTLSDITGKIRLIQAITRRNTLILKIGHLPVGIYILKLRTIRGILVKKIIVK